MGQSMGGGVTALVSNTLSSFPNYLGSVLLAPYLGVARVPHWLVLTILKHTVMTCFPNHQMPSWLDGMTDPRYSFPWRSHNFRLDPQHSVTWKHEETLQYAALDTWGNPGAVGYNLPMKWGTAGMFIEMGVAIKVSSLTRSSCSSHTLSRHSFIKSHFHSWSFTILVMWSLPLRDLEICSIYPALLVIRSSSLRWISLFFFSLLLTLTSAGNWIPPWHSLQSSRGSLWDDMGLDPRETFKIRWTLIWDWIEQTKEDILITLTRLN